jgi:hypothetical protein
MTADTNLSALLAKANSSAGDNQFAMEAYRKLLQRAHEDGQLITLVDAEAMVKAEHEACAAIADAYASENITMAHDTVIFDPVLSGKNGDHLTRSDFKKSEELAISGTIHSSMFHAAQNVAAAIRARGVE